MIHEGVETAFTYATQLHDGACIRMLDGEHVALLANELGVSLKTLYR